MNTHIGLSLWAFKKQSQFFSLLFQGVQMAHYWPGLPSPANVNWPIRAFEINLMGTYVQGTYFALRHFMHKKNKQNKQKNPKQQRQRKKYRKLGQFVVKPS